MNEYFIAWWNIENLFDVENSPTQFERLKKILKDELKGWGQTVLNNKLEQLSKAISKINDNNGPDILGISRLKTDQLLIN